MIQLPFLTPAEKKFLELQALRIPQNDNDLLRSANQKRVDDLLSQLNGMKARGTVYLQPEDGEFDGFREVV